MSPISHTTNFAVGLVSGGQVNTTDENEAWIEFIDWDRSGESPRIVGYKRYGMEEAYVEED